MPPLAVLSEFRVADPGGVAIVEFEDQRIRNVVVVSACGAGTFEICKTQFDMVSCRLTPIVCGPPPGPTNRPDTITYSTAASTNVIATMRMVEMTGDTASSSLRMMVFMVYLPPGIRSALQSSAGQDRGAVGQLVRIAARSIGRGADQQPIPDADRASGRRLDIHDFVSRPGQGAERLGPKSRRTAATDYGQLRPRRREPRGHVRERQGPVGPVRRPSRDHTDGLGAGAGRG